jgi:hypothetical protein
MKTFVDGRERILGYIAEMWVKCPQCGNCAIIRNKDRGDTSQFAERRLVCTTCPHVEDWVESGMAFPWYSTPADPCFGYPLWLQRSCCGDTLWAYNPSHLDFLKSFVSATQRTRIKDSEYGWSNKSMASRLPKWIQIAKNREAVLKAIGHLEAEKGRIEQTVAPNRSLPPSQNSTSPVRGSED